MSSDDRNARGAGYAEMTEALRDLLDAVAASEPNSAAMRDLTESMSIWTDRLGSRKAENEAAMAMRYTLPSRGRVMCPPFVVDQLSSTRVSGTVSFGAHFLGRNGAAHGGAIAMLFDEVFGYLANQPGEPRARTAHLDVDYLSIAPVDRTLQVEATIVQEEGRKLTLSGTLFGDQVPCARASALMIRLREGQP